MIYCIIATIVIYIATDFIIDLINYKTFKKRLIPGTKLVKTIKCIGNEFDPGTTFIIQITEVGKSQVKVQYSDGSKDIIDILELFRSWKLIK